MSLIVHLVVPGADDRWAEQTAHDLSMATGLPLRVDSHARHEGIAETALIASDSGGEIAQWVLNDEPDSRDAEWLQVRALERTVAELHRRAPRGIALQAKWVSDKLENTQLVSIAELLALLRDRKLRINTRYDVDSRTVG